MLSRIPTQFGRLVFMASLRKSGTGRYSHDGLQSLLGSEDIDRTLCRSHHQVFSEWLGFSLAEQKSDLEDYLGAETGSGTVVHYSSLVPVTARDVERQLFLTDLETVLGLLEVEHAVSADRAAFLVQ
jgi:hypothetical protein